MRAQHVVGVEFVALLKRGDARTQVGELPGGAVHHGQRQARTQDLDFDGVVIDPIDDPAWRKKLGTKLATAGFAIEPKA